MGGFGGESRARRKLMRRNKREVGTIRKNQWFFVILSLIVVGTLMTGCSKTTGSSAEKEEKRGQPYIMGEVVEVANATPTEKKKGVMGTIDIEGSRSQEIGEALITVTNKTKIIDERGGNPRRPSRRSRRSRLSRPGSTFSPAPRTPGMPLRVSWSSARDAV
jgi:hypothetical protein